MSIIADVTAREILDSRGNPTLEVDLILEDGTLGRAAVPSGASTGSKEARELRDGDPGRHRGRGVLRAVAAVRGEIRSALRGMDVRDQAAIDERLVEVDGTPDRGRLGGNSLLGASLAASYAGSRSARMPLYRYLGGDGAELLPVPMMNILNGGKHASNNVDVQEYMIVPAGADSFVEALRWGCEIYHSLGEQLAGRGLSRGVGDEGGYAPDLADDEEALALIVSAIERAGYRPGEQVWLALDVAASELCDDGRYSMRGERLGAAELTELYRGWSDCYPLIAIEDGMAEDDWEGWTHMTRALGSTLQLVGDDIFVTDRKLLRRGHRSGVANAILIKPNQIGTVTETLQALKCAGRIGYGACISHRSGETANTFIADLAVASGCGQIKSGAPCRVDRVEKYNQLLRIEEELGARAQFAGLSPFMLK
ncbi:MAG: phosphopyruvate hydratase [Bacillota bacterium]